MQLFLVWLIDRERVSEEVCACDRVARRVDVGGDQRAMLAVRGSDAVQPDAAGGLKDAARVHDGSYCHAGASADLGSLEHDYRGGEVAAPFDLAAGERCQRGDDALSGRSAPGTAVGRDRQRSGSPHLRGC